MRRFIHECLHPDGVLLLQFVREHVGGRIAFDLINQLFSMYAESDVSQLIITNFISIRNIAALLIMDSHCGCDLLNQKQLKLGDNWEKDFLSEMVQPSYLLVSWKGCIFTRIQVLT